jgi:hypothetical protein
MPIAHFEAGKGVPRRLRPDARQAAAGPYAGDGRRGLGITFDEAQ